MKMIIILGASLIAALASWRAVSGSAQDTNAAANQFTIVAAVEATKADLARTITLTAEFRPYQEVEVHAKVAGFVKSIPVDIGDRVKEGDVIATLEIPELDEDLSKAAAALDAARANVNQTAAAYQAANAVHDRLQQVAREHPKLVAQQELDDALSKDQGAAAGMASARQHVEEAEAEQKRQAALVAYSRLTAPFDGVITRRFVDVGALVQAGASAGSPVVTVAQQDVLRVIFPTPESAVSSVVIGKPVEIQVAGLDRKVEGAVTRFSREVNRETRTMTTEVDVPNADLTITPGMYGWAELTLEEHRDALNVPVQAISSGDKPTVLLINRQHRLEERPVKVGLETATRVEILDGLSADSLVYIGNRGQVRAGMRVQPKLIGG